jgi:urease accessory protein
MDSMMRALRLAAPPLAAALALLPGVASAHLVSTGFGPVTDGVWHFVLSPEQSLPMAAFGLLAGLRGPAHARRALFVLPSVWLAVALAGVALPAGWGPVVMAVAFLLTGGLLAANARLSPNLIAALAGLLGAVSAGAYGAEDASILATLGGAFTIFVLFALVSSAALSLKAGWTVIAVRVLGSWTAATGLLLVGWTLHSQP